MKQLFGLLFTLGVAISGYAQGLNAKLTRSIEKQDLKALMELYHEDAVLMPEFHAPVYGKQDIERYYKYRFRRSSVGSYVRTRYTSDQADKYVIETGTFSYTLSVADKTPVQYTGKYMVVWKADKKQELKILSEIWGSDQGLDREAVSLPDDTTYAYEAPEPVKIKDGVRQAIRLRTDEIMASVKKRDGVTLANLYGTEAIYMPYYSPMLVGKQKIHDYYIKHEDPNVTIDSVNIQFTRIIPVKDIAIVFGVYGVKWRAGDNAGTVTGKNLNIWRKEPDGQYLLFRQMVNHD